MNDEPESIDPPPPPAEDIPNVLALYLRQHGGNCPVCDYSLQNLASDQCPECGAPIELSIESPQKKIGPWITTLISYAMVAGFCLLFTLFIVVGTIRHGPPPGRVSGTFAIAAVIGCFDLLFIRRWIKLRFKFWRLTHTQQRRRAARHIALSVAPLVVIFILIFEML